MNRQDQQQDQLTQSICQSLDSHSAEPDELTRAALRAARYRALDQLRESEQSFWSQGWSRWSLAGTGAVCAIVLAWGLHSQSPDLEMASNQAEDAALIADLDLVLWLEDGDV